MLNKKNSAVDEVPLRSELFSAAQMATHGKRTAARHVLASRGGADLLLARLTDNAHVISETCAELTAATKAGRQITPASEWLLDNFYLIEEQIRIARRHLPKGYSKELPRLANEGANGAPRVYKIALEIISHGDGRVDPDSLTRFVEAYQEIVPLKLGELWAIPIMLRIALIENLRRVAARISDNCTQRDRANAWADEMVETAEENPSNLILLVADMARSGQSMNSGFVAEVARRLQGQNSSLTMALQWITTRLGSTGLTIEQLIQTEIGQQASDQVSISNSIGSLRFLGTMDWQEFVETMSVVETTLRRDPSGTYGKMDFATRDNYRHVIEGLAKQCDFSEAEIAEQVIALALGSGDPDISAADGRTRHVGYYLIGKGRLLLTQRLRASRTVGEAVQRNARTSPLTTYLGAIALVTALFSATLARPPCANIT